MLMLNCMNSRNKSVGIPPTKQKYVCFRLPPIPKFYVTDPNFLIAIFDILQLILFAGKCFQFQVYFCYNLHKKIKTENLETTCFHLFLQRSRAVDVSAEIKLLAKEN